MSIRVRLHRDGAITCHVRRNWLMRLLGFDDIDMEVEYSGGWYCNADTGMPGDGRTQRAIERQLAARQQ